MKSQSKIILSVLFGTTICLAELSTTFIGTPWNGKDWTSEMMTVTNTAKNPIYLCGIRFDTQNKIWNNVYNGEGSLATLTNSSPYRIEIILNNTEKNFGGNDVSSFSVTGTPGGKDGTPSNPSHLVRNGSRYWPLEIPYAQPVKVDQIDSLMNTSDFYNKSLGILDTLGQRGGPMSGGMIDTWYGLTQLQSALPTKPFNQNATWMTFEPKAYGNAMYMMTLAAMQEYFNIDMQMLIAKGGKENMAGMVQWNAIGNSYGEKLGVIYGTGNNGLSGVDFGPFSVEFQTFNDYVFNSYPKFYPLGKTTGTNDYYSTTSGSGGYCKLNKPNVVNATTNAVLYNWYTFQLGLHSSDYGFTKLITEGKDPQGAMKLALWAFNRGVSVGWLDVVSKSNQASLTYSKIEEYPAISERTYIDGIMAAIKPLMESARNSENLGGTEPIYDDTISLALVEQFLFGTGGSGTSGSSGEGGLLVHFELTKEKKQVLWSDVENAFDKLKGNAPSTKSSDNISYRYDFLTVLRVIKGHIDVSMPIPTNYKFVAWENSHSTAGTTFSGETKDETFPRILVQKSDTLAADQSPLVEITDNGVIRSVEWTRDTTLEKWNHAFGENSTSGSVPVDFSAPSEDLIGKPFPYWIRATDTWGNAEIQKFTGTYTKEGTAITSNYPVKSAISLAISGKILTLSHLSEGATLSVFNPKGQLIETKTIGSELPTETMNLSHLSAGFYIIQLQLLNNSTIIQRCVLK